MLADDNEFEVFQPVQSMNVLHMHPSASQGICFKQDQARKGLDSIRVVDVEKE